MTKGDWIQEMTELFAEYQFAYGDYAYQLACAYWSDEETPEQAMARYIEINTKEKLYYYEH